MHRLKLAVGLALCAGLVTPGIAQAKTSLVEVTSTAPAVLHQLEALGLDVTYEGDDRTELMLHGPEDRQILEDSGVAFKVLMEDMEGSNDARLEREATAQKRVEQGVAPLSGLPTGRVAYRDLATINAEIQQIATANPTKVKLLTLNHPTLLGKPVYGLEVSHNVAADRRQAGVPAVGRASRARVADARVHARVRPRPADARRRPTRTRRTCSSSGRLIAVPVVNADGYDLSRSLQNEQKRKNCRITSGVIPTLAECTATANSNRGIDPNRNYVPFWGGPGSSTSATASNTRGEAPGSEPEIKNMIELLNANRVTVAINNHTPDQRLLRAPSSSNEPDVVYDQAAYQALLERLDDNLTGWPSGPWTDVYYEASSTAEQQAFYAYGAFGFTPEATPGFSGNQTFHPPYENVINNYLGIGPRYAGQTMRGLYYDAFEAANDPALHSVITGTAAPGATLTLTKSVLARLVEHGLDDRPAGPGALVPEHVTTKLTVPSNGRFEWHVNPSVRPSQYSDQGIDEAYTLTCTAADGTVLETTTVKLLRGQQAVRSLCTQGGVGGTVPATLSLTLGTPATFGAFTPGVAREYDASTTANVISTAGNATLSVSDPDTVATGRLVNGAFSLPQPVSAPRRRARPAPAGRLRPSAAPRARPRC